MKVAPTSTVKTFKSTLHYCLPIISLLIFISMLYLSSYYTHSANPIEGHSSNVNVKDTVQMVGKLIKANPTISNAPQRQGQPTVVPKKHVIGKTNPESSLTSSTPQQRKPTIGTKKHIDKTADKFPMNPKALKYLPLNGPLSKRPNSTMHPDSRNPQRTYNTEPPYLPPCHREDDKVVSIYIESRPTLNAFFQRKFPTVNSTSCDLPDGVKCDLQSADKYSDAVFRFVYYIHSDWPLRYCQGQTLIVFNAEALRGTGPNYQQLDLADFRIDFFLTSDAYWNHVCMEFPNIFRGQPPSDPAKRTKAVAMFLSDCSFKWRFDYVKELMEYIHVDSHGKCFHNVKQNTSRFASDQYEIMTTTLQSYRMMVTFENLNQENYISEKIWIAYQGGAIPVYLGPPDIYNWIPGNHTFINIGRFSGPKELAEYMKRVAEDDELFKYHTSNFEWDRTKRMMDKYCFKADFPCRMCEFVYKRKTNVTKSGQ